MDSKVHRNLVEPSTTKPASQWAKAHDPSRGPFGMLDLAKYAVLRDSFTISTWLLLGACLQGILLATTRSVYCLIPAFSIIFLRITDAVLQATGVLPNSLMAGVINGDVSNKFATEDGTYVGRLADEEIVVFLLTARCNHPLGLLAPGFKETGDFFEANGQHLEANAEKYGFLGMSQWINTGDRASGSEILYVGYFRTVEGLHKWAAVDPHKAAWDWWTKGRKNWPHLQISHELYHVPKGSWETTYMNCAPTGLAMTSIPRTVTEQTEQGQEKQVKKWYSPMIDANRMRMRSSRVRMEE